MHIQTAVGMPGLITSKKIEIINRYRYSKPSSRLYNDSSE